MYARKYYFIIYRRNLIQEYSRNRHQPISFYEKSLLTFWPFDLFAIRSTFIKFTPFTIHLIHLFTFTSFTFSSRLSLPFPSYLHLLPFLSTSQHPGQRLKKSGTTLSFLAKMY